MEDFVLTQRQIKLLNAIVNEFMDTAEAVGSSHLPNKYDLNISPATIRNEMILLAKKGLLRKSHISSGRIPTSRAFRFFIDELMDHLEEFESTKEAAIKESIFQLRFSIDRLLYEAVRKLTHLTNNIAVAVYEDRVYYSGLCELVNFPEYQQQRKLHEILTIIENSELLSNLFSKYQLREDDVYILIGEDDTGLSIFEATAIVFGKLFLHGNQVGYIAVIGPNRMNYSAVIPAVRWMVKTINTSVKGW